MTNDESMLAVKAVQVAWRLEPMEDMEARQFRRMFLGHPADSVRAVIDEQIAKGNPRPGPADFSAMLRIKAGKPVAGRRVQHPGPFLTEQPVPDDFSDRIESLRQLTKGTT